MDDATTQDEAAEESDTDKSDVVGVSEERAKRGATYTTDWMFEDGKDPKITINPTINFSKSIRIFNVSKRVIEWLSEGELVITVKGCSPTALAKEDHKIREEEKDAEEKRKRLREQREKECKFAKETANKVIKENEAMQKKIGSCMKDLEGFAQAQLTADKKEEELQTIILNAKEAWNEAETLQLNVDETKMEAERLLAKRDDAIKQADGLAKTGEKVASNRIAVLGVKEKELDRKKQEADRVKQKALDRAKAAQMATENAEQDYQLVLKREVALKKQIDIKRMRYDKLEYKLEKGSRSCTIQ